MAEMTDCALARRFINNHYKVVVICLFDEAELTQDCRTNFVILKQMISKLQGFQAD
ncbi:MAG: hypothetical protein MZV64_58400 [Ignavibacteriales bacterium]|nr:hypothetical protein [Ignavibacteriales bacterium]